MTYKTLKKLFHNPKTDEKAAYDMRFNDPNTLKLNLEVAGAPAFVYMAPELYNLLLSAQKLDKQILSLEYKLPFQAVENFAETCLIGEIVLTNDIEGVSSTRREVSDTLALLKANDRHGRFAGIVQKYQLLGSTPKIELATCQNVRELYDEIVLDEVIAENPNNAPDGKIFRKETVHVVNAGGIPIHDGLSSEAAIIGYMNASLEFLHSAQAPKLVKVAAFHFLFGYIHPFYDGNGRMNRFISSYLISQEYEPITALNLSYAIKQNLRKYYAAFSECEHTLNKGDLTPFVLAFCEIVVDAMTHLCDNLAQKEAQFTAAYAKLESVMPPDSNGVAQVLLGATLFSENGATAQGLAEILAATRQTVYKKLAPFKELSLLKQTKVGHQTYYTLNLDTLLA